MAQAFVDELKNFVELTSQVTSRYSDRLTFDFGFKRDTFIIDVSDLNEEERQLFFVACIAYSRKHLQLLIRNVCWRKNKVYFVKVL